MRWLVAAVAVVSLVAFAGCAKTGRLVLVDNGKNAIPIIVPAKAPVSVTEAAADLAAYIEKISGARPAILTGAQVRLPEHAIWAGLQPQAERLFSGATLSLGKPEEILILCDGQNLLLAGRDRSDGEAEMEAGTCNAIYTFIQKNLGVRWLWPGPLGEDVVKSKTIAVAPFRYQYAPQFRQREVIMHWVWRWFEPDPPVRQQLIDWVRRQRNLYDSLDVESGHPMADWYELYHEKHPDWFALQPDGTRGTYPDPVNTPWFIKVCQSNPEVQKQWLDNVAETMKKEPGWETFGAAASDAAFSGICVCDNCRAWDDPDAPLLNYDYAQGNVQYPSVAQRYVVLWNLLARALKERFPDKRLYVVGAAYGPTEEPPTKITLDENIIIPYCAGFPLSPEADRRAGKAQWCRWAKIAPMLTYRPNLWYFDGGGWGFPAVDMGRTIEDFRFLAENRCVGIAIDMNRDFWAVHGPEYYLMTQLAWDPLQDGQALLEDYYSRAFGPAAGEIRAYWALMEDAHARLVNDPDFKEGNANRFGLPPVFERVYSPELLDKASAILTQAAAKTAGGPEIYSKRVAFVRSGFEVTSLVARNIPLMTRVRYTGGEDAEAVKQVVSNWEEIDRICAEAGPHAIRNSGFGINFWLIENGYMAGMQDYFGPPSEKFRKAAGIE